MASKHLLLCTAALLSMFRGSLRTFGTSSVVTGVSILDTNASLEQN